MINLSDTDRIVQPPIQEIYKSVIFNVVPCIFNNVRVLLPTNALFIRHVKC